MKSFKRALRLIGLGLLIILALMGVGVTGAVFINKKEQDYDNEIKTELAEGKEDTIEEKDVE
jgi:flagellar basal body-associated protein FliL